MPSSSLAARARILVTDAVVACAVYLVVHRLLRGSFWLPELYVRLGVAVVFGWVLVASYFGKYRLLAEGRKREALTTTLWIGPIVLGGVAGASALTPLWGISRSLLLVVVGAIGVVTAMVDAVVWRRFERESAPSGSADVLAGVRVVVPWRVLVGGATLVTSFAVASWLKTGVWNGYGRAEIAVLVVAGSWALAAAMTGKYVTETAGPSPLERLAAHARSVALMLMLSATFYLMLRLDELSRWMLFGTLLLYGLAEVPAALAGGKGPEEDAESTAASHSPPLSRRADERPVQRASHAALENAARRLSPLESGYAVALREFLAECRAGVADSDGAVVHSTLVLAQGELDDLIANRGGDLSAIVSTEPLNAIGPLNEYLRAMNLSLGQNGVVVGGFRPLESVRADFRRKFPPVLRELLYAGHFVLFRVLPRLPVTRVLYARVLRLPQRALTRTEAFGRMRFCGLRVLLQREANGYVYFMAQRDGEPHTGPAPKYGPLIQLERRGHRGRPVRIYKLRTMHAYSEFLQQDLFARENLDSTGKLHEDARVTTWGRTLRKYWLDELPQLLNWLRGDIRLVGVRPVSAEFLALFPRDVRELRTRVRPGLIPPYYADMPTSFEEIVESERRYLMAKIDRPFVTDVRYLLRIARNILSGARSK